MAHYKKLPIGDHLGSWESQSDQRILCAQRWTGVASSFPIIFVHVGFVSSCIRGEVLWISISIPHVCTYACPCVHICIYTYTCISSYLLAINVSTICTHEFAYF